MSYADVNGIQMYYEEQGQGQPLVLLHGGAGSIDATSGWSKLLPSLAARYRAICVEHRGHGRTNNPAGRLAYALIAEDIAQFIEHLGLAPAHVAGVSDGGIVGLTLGMTRPEIMRSLVCVGANYCIDDHVRAALRLFDAAVLERDHPEYARVFAERHDPHHHEGYWRELVQQVRTTAEIEPAWTTADLRRVLVPTLLITGESDFLVSLDQTLTMRREIPDAELVILNHAGLDGMANHLVQFSRPDVVGSIVLDFLERHSGTAKS